MEISCADSIVNTNDNNDNVDVDTWDKDVALRSSTRLLAIGLVVDEADTVSVPSDDATKAAMPATLSSALEAGSSAASVATNTQVGSQQSTQTQNTKQQPQTQKAPKEPRTHPYQQPADPHQALLDTVRPTPREIHRSNVLFFIPTTLPPLKPLVTNPAQSPYPVWAVGSAFAAALIARAMRPPHRSAAGWPHPGALLTGVVASAALGSLVIADPVVGASTVATWSTAWILLAGRSASRSPLLLPRALNAAVIASGLLYGTEFVRYMRL